MTTTKTTNDPPPDTKADAALEGPSVALSQPELEGPHASSQPELEGPSSGSESELESRIKQRRAELIGRLGELRAEAGLEASQARDKLKARLSELAHILKEGVVDGWASLGDLVRHKLKRWLSESERSLASCNLPSKNVRS